MWAKQRWHELSSKCMGSHEVLTVNREQQETTECWDQEKQSSWGKIISIGYPIPNSPGNRHITNITQSKPLFLRSWFPKIWLLFGGTIQNLSTSFWYVPPQILISVSCSTCLWICMLLLGGHILLKPEKDKIVITPKLIGENKLCKCTILK